MKTLKPLPNRFQRFICGIATVFALSVSVSSATTILVSDTLTSATPQSLNGTSPQIGGGTFSIGDPYGVFTESAAGTSENGGAQADLSIDPIAAGQIYTLSVTETATGNPDGIIYLGFYDDTAANAGQREFYTFAGATIEKGGGNNNSATLDTNAGQFAQMTPTGVNGLEGPNVLTLVLNTESPAYTLTGFLNGGEVSSFTYTTNPTGLNAVYIATSGVPQVEFKNLELTTSGVAVPEPSTWAFLVLGLGALGLHLRQRGRRMS